MVEWDVFLPVKGVPIDHDLDFGHELVLAFAPGLQTLPRVRPSDACVGDARKLGRFVGEFWVTGLWCLVCHLLCFDAW